MNNTPSVSQGKQGDFSEVEEDNLRVVFYQLKIQLLQ